MPTAAVVARVDHAPSACPAPVLAKKRLPKVVDFTRRFANRPPIVVGLADEMLDRWLNGTLTLSLSKDYRTHREIIEYLLWKQVAPIVRAARRGAIALLLGTVLGVQAMPQMPGPHVAVVRAARKRSGRRRGLEDGYQPEEFRVFDGCLASGAGLRVEVLQVIGTLMQDTELFDARVQAEYRIATAAVEAAAGKMRN